MNRGWILVVAASALVACNKPDSSGANPAASTPASSAAPSAAALAMQPPVNAQGDVVDPTLPSAAEAESTNDITASTYKKDLDGLDKEIAGLK